MDGTDGYIIHQGIVDDDRVQISTLTISAAKLAELNTSSPLTWKCAAQTSHHPDFEDPFSLSVVVTFLTLGSFLFNYQENSIIMDDYSLYSYPRFH